MALPLPAPKPNKGSGTSGYVYVYAWQATDWCPEAESLVADLATTAGLLYEEVYTGAAKERLEDFSARQAREGMISIARHELGPFIDLIKPGITAPWAQALQQYFSAQLHIGDTNASEFAGDPKNVVEKWFKEVWFIRHLRLSPPADPAAVDDAFVAKAIQGVSESLVVVIDESIQSRVESTVLDGYRRGTEAETHFMAALFAAFSNAIRHTYGRQNPRYVISISTNGVRPELWVTIENSFDSNSEINREVWNQYKLKVHKNEMGSELAIRYLVSQYRESEPTLFIRINERCLVPENGCRAEWVTHVPVPYHVTVPST